VPSAAPRRSQPRAALLARVLDYLKLPIFVFERGREIYANPAAVELSERLRTQDHIELRVLLLDHLASLQDVDGAVTLARSTVTLLTSHSGEPFYLHVMPLDRRRPTYAVSVRSSGADVHAFRQRYRLSARESQITELVLRGCGNREIAQTLGITTATAKKHLGRIFDKVGVDSRSQLRAKLG
jgi:DNA-binding CsgD family transcriptional regulator